MLDNLSKIEVNPESIEKIKSFLNNNVLISLASNYEKVNSNIRLFLSYGIEDIDELFINKYYAFLEDTNVLIKKFEKFNIPVFIEIINNDCNAIDDIL